MTSLLAELNISPDTTQELENLLAAWRQTWNPALADALEQISTRLPVDRQIEKVSLREARFVQLLASRHPALLGVALKYPWPLRAYEAQERLKKLQQQQPDPRISRAVLRLLQNNPWQGKSWKNVEWVGACVLICMQDRQSAEVFQNFSSADFLLVHGQRVRWKQALAALPTPLELTEVQHQQLGHWQQGSAVQEQELWNAVYASPEQDAPRLVLADFLCEQNNPRGEFIQLQCMHSRGEGSVESRKKEAKLLKEHGDSWIAEVPGCSRQRAVFERGFLASGRPRLEELAKLADIRWSTVHSLELGTYQNKDLIGILSLPSLKNLRHLNGDSWIRAGTLPEVKRLESLACVLDCIRPRMFKESRLQALHLALLEPPWKSLKNLDFLEGSLIKTLTIQISRQCPMLELVELFLKTPNGLDILRMSSFGARPLNNPVSWVFTVDRKKQLKIHYGGSGGLDARRQLEEFLPLFKHDFKKIRVEIGLRFVEARAILQSTLETYQRVADWG
jgi:uncharacterized protein (TIGR02996 family)